MNYNGIGCPVCGQIFEENDDVVVCPICGTPHHRNCWNENGSCINEAKHSEGFIWQTMNAEVPVMKNPSADKKICPVCGHENDKFEPVCTNCGERLKRAQINQFPQPEANWNNSPSYQYNPQHNVYSQDAKTVYGENTKIDDIPVTDVAEFVQKDSVKYIGKFIAMEQNNTKFSWNWSAALAGIYWCFYRKMMGLGVAILAIIFSLNLVAGTVIAFAYEKYKPDVYAEYKEIVADIDAMMEDYPAAANYDTSLRYLTSPITITSTVISAALSLLASVTLGFFGNYFYKKKVIKDIHTVRRLATDNMVYHIYLKQKGNVSVVNLLMPMLINSLLNMFISFF